MEWLSIPGSVTPRSKRSTASLLAKSLKTPLSDSTNQSNPSTPGGAANKNSSKFKVSLFLVVDICKNTNYSTRWRGWHHWTWRRRLARPSGPRAWRTSHRLISWWRSKIRLSTGIRASRRGLRWYLIVEYAKLHNFVYILCKIQLFNFITWFLTKWDGKE